MQEEIEEIFTCCNFLLERIEKEMNILEDDFYICSSNNDKYKDLLFNQFKKLILKENDIISEEEYLFIIKRIITIFKQLKKFQNVQFGIDMNPLNDELYYIKFYKEIFDIINYITNLYPIEDYNYVLKDIYPSYINYKRLQQLLPPYEYNNTNNNNNNNNISTTYDSENAIRPDEIMKMFRCFLLLILLRSFQYMQYTLNEFIQIFLNDKFRHDKYIGFISQQKLNLLYDIIHRPPIIKIFSKSWYNYQYHIDETQKFKKTYLIKDILHFGLFLKELNDNFIEVNEFYNLKFCLIYFFLLFPYDDFNFLAVDRNKKNYPSFISYAFKEVLIEELFDEENVKKLKDTLSYKILNFMHGKYYCSIFPIIYFEKFFVDGIIQKVKNDKVLNFPKDPNQYYLNRLLMYQNLKELIGSFSVQWEDIKILKTNIQEKITNTLNSLRKCYGRYN